MYSKIQRLLFVSLLCFAISSCVYVDIKTPLDTDVNQTVLGPKVGVSQAHSLLWLVAWGDAGTAAAAKNGGLSTINHLDSRYQSYFFGIYSKRETIAYGE